MTNQEPADTREHSGPEETAAATDTSSHSDAQLTPLRLTNILLSGLLLLAVFYTLYVARIILIPIVAAVLLSLLLSPVVRALSRRRIFPAVSAALIVVALIGGIGFAGYQLVGPAAEYVKKLPNTARRLAQETRGLQASVEEVRQAAEEAGDLSDGTDRAEEPTRVKVEGMTFGELVLNATRQALVGMLICLTLLYFLLAGKDQFLEKLVGALSTISDKKRAVTAVRNVEQGVASFLLAYSINNAILGVAVATALWWLDMPNALFFGVVVALFNFVPYAGAIASTIVIALASATAFYDFSSFIAPPAAFLILTTLEGTLLQPLIVGRRMALNPVAILVSLIFWSWLWGVPGALMAIPILAVMKRVLEESPALRHVAAFFGR